MFDNSITHVYHKQWNVKIKQNKKVLSKMEESKENSVWKLLQRPTLQARCNQQGVFQPPDWQCSHLGPLVLFCAADINSAGCKGMTTTVTVAHHSIWRQLYDSMHAVQKSKSKLRFEFVTLDNESSMNTLWWRAFIVRICSTEDRAEKAHDIEVTTPVQRSKEA